MGPNWAAGRRDAGGWMRWTMWGQGMWEALALYGVKGG